MTIDILQEIWLPIAGYEGAYEVSNFGNVRSLDKTVRGRMGSARFLKGKTLKSKPCGAGYRSVNLSINNLTSTKLIHILVAKAFIGDRLSGCEVNHIDGIKSNNRIDNLEYCTHSENALHAIKTGLRTPVRGEKIHHAKFSEAEIPTIRNRVAAGESQNAIAKEYGVNSATIHSLYHGKTWSHILAEHTCNKKPSPYSKGSSRHSAKLNEKDIPVIRQRLASGETGIAIAKEYGVQPSAISNIKHGKKWSHVR